MVQSGSSRPPGCWPTNCPNQPTNLRINQPTTHTHARCQQGLLEKHKDYILRARDFQRKQGALKQLRHKAAARNPDEFYFAMQQSKTKGAW